LKGVLRWNRNAALGGRNLDLVHVMPNECDGQLECPRLVELLGKRAQQPGPALFFANQSPVEPRLLSNRVLFDAVRDVRTDFRLEPRDAWLLRWVARWSVAHRMWQLCQSNAEFLRQIDRYKAACQAPLPPRGFDDDIGGDAYRAAGLP
jgi:hypothetical protein